MKPSKNNSLLGLLFLVSVFLFATGPQAFGLGIALPDQDAFATARGNAFTATANDPAAVFYNPAGISQLPGINLSLGSYGLAYGDHFTSPGGAKIDSRTEWAAYPDIFATFKLPNLPLTVGIGAYTPFGLVEEWPGSAPFAYAAKRGEIDYYTFNPVISYKPIKGLSFAIGPTFNYSEVDLRQYIAPLPYDLHFRGRDEAAGFNAGILWQPLPEHSFGINYRSATTMDYSGHATLPNPLDPLVPSTYSTKANFKFPQTVDFGYSFRPTEKWNIELDGEWLDWETLNAVNLVGTSIPGNPTLESLPFNWRSSWIGKLGGTRYFGDGWRVSAGYMYVQNSVPTEYFNPLVPDSDRHVFSVGIGKQWHNLSWDLAYQLAWAPSRDVTGDLIAGADGKYEFLSHAFTFNVGYHF